MHAPESNTRADQPTPPPHRGDGSCDVTSALRIRICRRGNNENLRNVDLVVRVPRTAARARGVNLSERPLANRTVVATEHGDNYPRVNSSVFRRACAGCCSQQRAVTKDHVQKTATASAPWPPCPSCGSRAVAVVDRTADTAYLVCSECEHTWRVASQRPKQRTRA